MVWVSNQIACKWGWFLRLFWLLDFKGPPKEEKVDNAQKLYQNTHKVKSLVKVIIFLRQLWLFFLTTDLHRFKLVVLLDFQQESLFLLCKWVWLVSLFSLSPARVLGPLVEEPLLESLRWFLGGDLCLIIKLKHYQITYVKIVLTHQSYQRAEHNYFAKENENLVYPLHVVCAEFYFLERIKMLLWGWQIAVRT